MENLKEFLEENGYTHLKKQEDGSYTGLMEYMFTTGLMVGLTENTYKVRYCYEHFEDAFKALQDYTNTNEDPLGPWIKAKGLGQDRLNPLWCDISEEKVAKKNKARH